MSDTQKKNFYGETGRPTVCEVLETLRTLTGSESCAKELVEAADYVESVCGEQAVLMAQPACLRWEN